MGTKGHEHDFLKIGNAEVVSDATGRQYHIDLAPGEVADYVMLVGDPMRSERAAKTFLTDIRVDRSNREFRSFTGKYNGLEVTILSTGIGPSNVEITMVECFQIAKNPTFIRVGTCGALQPEMKLGDFIISTGAVRLEDSSTFFVHDGYPSIANYEVNLALMKACEQKKHHYHLGITATASGFYGAQGRHIPGLPLRYPHLQDEMTAQGIANFEMESSTLFTMATLMKLRASTICLAIAHRPTGGFIDPESKKNGEKTILLAALDAFHELDRMDKAKAKAGKPYWYDGME